MGRPLSVCVNARLRALPRGTNRRLDALAEQTRTALAAYCLRVNVMLTIQGVLWVFTSRNGPFTLKHADRLIQNAAVAVEKRSLSAQNVSCCLALLSGHVESKMNQTFLVLI